MVRAFVIFGGLCGSSPGGSVHRQLRGRRQARVSGTDEGLAGLRRGQGRGGRYGWQLTDCVVRQGRAAGRRRRDRTRTVRILKQIVPLEPN